MKDVKKVLYFIKSGNGRKTDKEIMDKFGWDKEQIREFVNTYYNEPKKYIDVRYKTTKQGKIAQWEVSFEGEEFLRKEKYSLKGRIKEKWIEYLLFSVITIILSTSITLWMNYTFAEATKGPVCRIYSDTKSINASKDIYFKLPFLIINTRGQAQIVDDISPLCYWDETSPAKDKVVIINQTENDMGSLPEPEEPEVIPPYQTFSYQGLCKTPSVEGKYEIIISVDTNLGNCKQTIDLIVR